MANKSTVIIDTKTAETLLREVESMRQSLETLRKKIIRLFPSKYGSSGWWEREIEEADTEIKAGKIRELHSMDELDKPFKKLFS